MVFKMAWEILLYKVIELVIALIIGVLAMFLAVKVFEKLTRGIDEWEELKKGNVAVAILMSSIVLSVALMVIFMFGL